MDDQDLLKLKDLRAKSKRKVTVLIKKLTGSLQYGDHNSSGLRIDLENEFDSLLDLSLQIEEIETESDYMIEIGKSYDEVMKLFHNSIKENEIIKKEKEALILKHKIEREIKEISDTMDRLNAKLSKDPSLISKLDVFEIEEDKTNLPKSLDDLLSESAGLGLLVENMSELECKIDKTVSMGNKIMRDANIFLKMSNSQSATSEEDLKQSEKSLHSVSNLSCESPVFAPGKRVMSSAITSPSHKTLACDHGMHDDPESEAVQGALSPPLPSVIHTKRPSLPFFSGERADWPEFRCVWRSLAEAQYVNKMQLAMELKRCC